jgi:hypothetical protein
MYDDDDDNDDNVKKYSKYLLNSSKLMSLKIKELYI